MQAFIKIYHAIQELSPFLLFLCEANLLTDGRTDT